MYFFKSKILKYKNNNNINITKNEDKITFVLPIKGELDILRAFKILIPSIIKFCNIDDIFEFIIISTKEEYDIINNNIFNLDNNIKSKMKLINETEIISDIENYFKLIEWKRQQLLKLEVSKIVKTKIYITLDCDIFLIKKFCLKNCFVDNKIIYNIEKFNKHPEWWIDSAKLLNYDLVEEKCTFDVTPSILITSAVIHLLDYLNISDYSLLLYNEYQNWTEYTLYWLFLINNNYENYYVSNKITWDEAKLYGYAIWDNNDIQDINNIKNIYDLIIEKNKHSKTSYFSIIQSNTNILNAESKIEEFANNLLSKQIILKPNISKKNYLNLVFSK